MTRRFHFGPHAEIAVLGTSVSADYARQWLRRAGLSIATEAVPGVSVFILDGSAPPPMAADGSPTVIRVWDFQVDMPGTGMQASAVSGVSWVLGREDGPPFVLPADLPEKWCGLFAATLAVVTLVERGLDRAAPAREFDVSAADVLRAFADQNAGNHAEIVHGWRRNGRTAVEHGGIYPQGFFECADGFVAIVGRSRKDWYAIRKAVGWPSWAEDPRFEDPFLIAADSAEIDRLLITELKKFRRDELLQRALEFGATIAPVYSGDELVGRNIVRGDFFDEKGQPALPFSISAR